MNRSQVHTHSGRLCPLWVREPCLRHPWRLAGPLGFTGTDSECEEIFLSLAWILSPYGRGTGQDLVVKDLDEVNSNADVRENSFWFMLGGRKCFGLWVSVGFTRITLTNNTFFFMFRIYLLCKMRYGYSTFCFYTKGRCSLN